MAIQPIDLQTLFVRLSTVGREQSALKQAVIQAQTVAGEEIAEKSQESGHHVRETDEVSEGPETVKDDESKQHPRDQRHREGESDESAATQEEEVFRDPDLGRNIDLSG